VALKGLQQSHGVFTAVVTLPDGGCRHVDKSKSHAIVDLPREFYDYGYTWHAHLHNDCVCNELVALHNRHLMHDDEVAVSHEGLLNLAESRRLMLAELHPVSPWTYEKCIGRMPKAKQGPYRKAMLSLLQDDITKFDAAIDFMLKLEKVELDKLKIGKAGRGIQYRGKRYTLALMAAGLKSIEEETYKRMRFGPSATRNIAKGLNQSQRARLLHTKWGSFGDPVAVLFDATAWDAHVVLPLLDMEHSYYNLALPSRRMKMLLSWQRKNRGRTRGGIKYVVQGTRMSGDANTALGNCVLNLMILMSVLRTAGVVGEILLDGDDSVVIIERRDLPLVKAVNIGEHYGMNMKMEIAESFEHIDFCQSRPVEISDGEWRMVRYPTRAMSKDVVCVRNMVGKWHQLAKAIGECELSMCSGVPVLQEFALMMMRAGGSVKCSSAGTTLFAFEDLVYRAGREGPAVARPITNCARRSVWEAFDLSPMEQQELESRLRAHEPLVHPTRLALDLMGDGVPV